MDGNSLMFCGIEFQTTGAANRKAVRPMALAVIVTCQRLTGDQVHHFITDIYRIHLQ